MDSKALVGVVVVAHGRLGHELVAVARTIVEEIEHIVPVSIGWHDEVEEDGKRIEKAVAQVDAGRGVILLTDMFGGTPSNVALSLLKKGEREIITGVNLPMLIKLAEQSGDESLAELAVMVREQGKRQISIASELLGE
ncbi:MAG: PTS sugar transporter subunit IIA [Acidobacteriota bacterium]